MNVKVTTDIIPLSKARSGQKLRRFKGITFHETGNFSKNAGAQNHRNYMHNGGKNVECSYHYVVDDKETFLLVPKNEKAWSNGDGATGTGNAETISFEICVNPECDFSKAIDNACYIAATVLKENSVTKVVDGMKDKANGNVFQHFSWSGKNCPMQIRRDGKWDTIVDCVRKHLDTLNGKEEPQPPTPTGKLYKVQLGAFSVKSNADNLLRKVKDTGFKDAYIKHE